MTNIKFIVLFLIYNFIFILFKCLRLAKATFNLTSNFLLFSSPRLLYGIQLFSLLSLLHTQLAENMMLDVVVSRSLTSLVRSTSLSPLALAPLAVLACFPSRPHPPPYRLTSDSKPQFSPTSLSFIRNLSTISSRMSYQTVSRGSPNTGDFRLFITAADGTPVSGFHDIPM